MKILLIFITTLLYAECDEPTLRKKAHEVSPGFLYLKEYAVQPRSGVGRQSYVLTRGTTYRFSLTCETGGPFPFTLIDKEGRAVATNNVNGTLAGVIDFKSASTGIFYFEYQNPADNCGMVTVFFKKP